MRRLVIGVVLAAVLALGAHQSWAAAVSFVTNTSTSASANTTFTPAPTLTFSGACQGIVIFFWGGTDILGVTASVGGQNIPIIANTSTTKAGTLGAGNLILAAAISPALSGSQAITVSWTTTQAAAAIMYLLNNASGFNNGKTAGDSSSTTFTNFSIALNSNASDMSVASVNDPNNATSNFTTITTAFAGSSCTGGGTMGACVGDRDSGAGGSPVTHTFTLNVGNTAGWGLNAVNAVQTGVGCAAPAAGPGPGWLPNLGVGMWVPHSLWNRRLRLPWGIR